MRSALLLGLWLAGAPLAAAPAPRGEAPAGEESTAPTRVPSPSGDERGTVAVSRTAQAAAFALPVLVVTGEGEHRAAASRGELGGDLDTSGGLKTSPAEEGAGKLARAREAERAEAPEDQQASRPGYARLGLGAGLPGSLALDALLAAERGPAWGWLEGNLHSGEGAPGEPRPRGDAALAGHLGWRPEAERELDLGAQGGWRWRRLAGQPQAWLRRDLAWGSAAWEGPLGGLPLRAGFGAGRRQASSEAAEGNYSESAWDLEASSRGRLQAWGRSLGLEGGLKSGGLSQGGGGSSRNLWRSGAWGQALLSPWAGARLGLGLKLDALGGGLAAFQAGPLLSLEQGLGAGMGLKLRLSSSLALSGLEGEAFARDWLLPSAALAPARRLEARAAFSWQPAPGAHAEAGVSLRREQDAFLPDPSGRPGLWRDSPAGALSLGSLDLRLRLEQGEFWEELLCRLQSVGLDAGGRPSFLEPWGLELKAGWKRGPYSAQTRLRGLGPRPAALSGDWSMAAQWDLGLRAAWAPEPRLELWAGAEHLAGPAEEFPGDAQAAPWAGLGLDLRY